MPEIVVPTTMWYSQLGLGDSHDYATRGYLIALMRAGYEGLRLAPSKYTSVLRINAAGMEKDLAAFSDLAKPPPRARMKPLVRVQAGDPRVGTKRMVGNVEIEITEGSIDLDVPQQYTSSTRSELKCILVHHDPTSICRTYAAMAKTGRGEGVAYVGLTAWESSHIPKSIAIVLSELDWIIVPSEHTKKALTTSGVMCPISVVPHTFDAALWRRPTSEELHHRSDGRFVFYAIATPIERKNLLGLITAYYRAFEAKDNVVLRIKTNMDASRAQELLDKAAAMGFVSKEKPLVKFYPGQWSMEKMRAFHLDGNCYVSATRGEGFGLPELEARLCGRPVITTNWGAAPEVVAPTPQRRLEEVTGGSGGPYRIVEAGLLGGVTEAGTEHVYLVDAFEIPVEGMYGIGCYEPDQKWADPDPVALCSAMRTAYKKGPCVDPYAWDLMQQRFGEEAVGSQFADVLRSAQDAAAAEDEDLDGFQH